MRRITPSTGGVMVPRVLIQPGALRTLTARTALMTEDGTSFASACLGCPDQRCARFTEHELARPARVESPYSPDPAVCPTDAMRRATGGTMTVAPDQCLGCGLCVVRCPVGAIHLDPKSAVAQVEHPTDAFYEVKTLTAEEFDVLRSSLSGGMTPEQAPFADAAWLRRQMLRASPMVEGTAGQRVLRMLVRNTFLLGGAAARLKNVGDNNAPAELLVDGGDDLLVVEVEPSTDVPDAIRRALAGCAVAIARLGAERDEVTAAVVVARLPNVRVEYYRVAQDVYERLGIATYGVPLALLLLAIRAGAENLVQLLRELCFTNGSVDAGAVSNVFGNLVDTVEVGLVPPK